MGTNYYAKLEDDTELHIGKSSGGWCFSLHIYPKIGIDDLPDWIDFLAANHYKIKNEYEEPVTLDELFGVITLRKGRHNFDEPFPESNFCRYKSWEEFHNINYSEPGPNGLLRHQLGYGCVKQGSGTWDCIDRVFS